ncbi:MAG: hypothetical protein JOY91_03145 [Sinobacteraceae bacterium]|nr:hypothetical protein [Nevskiaceae bacterium]
MAAPKQTGCPVFAIVAMRVPFVNPGASSSTTLRHTDGEQRYLAQWPHETAQ